MDTPPAREASGRRAACVALLLAPARGALLLAAASLSACAGGNAPWDVAEGDEARFRRAQRECRMLTQDAAGSEGPISFDQCMNRRGFDRMNPVERLWKGA
jgi:hypothetical protein